MSLETTTLYRALSIVSTFNSSVAPLLYELDADSVEIGSAEDNEIVLADASIASHHCAVRRTAEQDHLVVDLAARLRQGDRTWLEFREGDTYLCPRHGTFDHLDARAWCPLCKRKRGSIWLVRPLTSGDVFDIGATYRATYIAEKRSGLVATWKSFVANNSESSIQFRALPTDDSNLWRWQPEGVPFPIFMHQRVNVAITQHARENREREVGGVLLGDVQQDERGRLYIVVTQAVKAEFADETRGHLTFTQKTWLEIHRARETLYPDKTIVGWYHTHPGWTIFLSPWDLFIHQNFFRQPWQIALVIDPSLDRAGFFVWKDNQVNNPHAPIEPFRLAELDGWEQTSKPRARIKLTDGKANV